MQFDRSKPNFAARATAAASAHWSSRSLWSATAIAQTPTRTLQESLSVDVAIVGGGYTGLSTALHLAEQGIQCCVLESQQVGWGASGRNGGQVIPGLKYDPQELIARFGSESAQRLIDTVGNAADVVFDLIAKHHIDCAPVRSGWIQPAHCAAAMRGLERRAAQWAERGAQVELLDAATCAERLGTNNYVGAWVDRRAGSVQPLSYARGLARVAMQLGVPIYTQTPVASLRRVADRWQLTTAQGAIVTARRVVLATNGYTDQLWPGLRESVIPANSFVLATRPLDAQLLPQILPGGEVCSDARRLLLYFRRDAQGRLILGGRGPFHEPRSTVDFAHLARAVSLLFPQLKGVEFDYHWAGRIALTLDSLPHLHEPAPGLSMLLGYNGRGIALATTLGKLLAQRIATDSTDDMPLPLTPIKPIPLHGLQRWYIAAGVAWYGLLDRFS